MPTHFRPPLEFIRRAVTAVITHPLRLFAAFAVLLSMAGAVAYLLASDGLHRFIDKAMLDEQCTVASQAAAHLAASSAFERDPLPGGRPRYEADRALLQREIDLLMRTLGVKRIVFFSRDLHPLAAAPVYSDSLVSKDIAGLRDLEANNDRPLADRDDLEQPTVRYLAPVQIDGRNVGYVAMDVDTAAAHRIAHTAFSAAQAHLAWALLVGFGLLLAPMYLSVLGNTAEHRALLDTNAKLHEMATMDALTGVFNRNSLNLYVEREFQLLRRQAYRRTSMCVAMIDIDHFKRINDTFGHVTGDQVLAEVAARLKSSLRGYDLVGRYGGEEFLTLLPNTDADGAAVVGERIRHLVSGTPVTIGHDVVSVTVSVGIALVTDSATRDLDAIKCADAALYRAKSGGRNRVVIDVVSTSQPSRADASCSAQVALPMSV